MGGQVPTRGMQPWQHRIRRGIRKAQAEARRALEVEYSLAEVETDLETTD